MPQLDVEFLRGRISRLSLSLYASVRGRVSQLLGRVEFLNCLSLYASVRGRVSHLLGRVSHLLSLYASVRGRVSHLSVYALEYAYCQ